MVFRRGLAGGRTATRLCAVAAALLLAQGAGAAPPSVTGSPITAAMPNINEQPITIDLRALGVITGSAPLTIEPASLQMVIDGLPDNGLLVSLFPNNGPGRVCVTIANSGTFTVGGQTFGLAFSVNNLVGPATPLQTVPITNTPGNVVDTPAEQQACDDPNTTPVANAGPDQTIQDVGAPGEAVTLDGSGSSDADPGTILTYQWFVSRGTALGPPSTSPTFTTGVLAPGNYAFTLQVLDDANSPDSLAPLDEILVTILPNTNALPIANAGPDFSVPDTDRDPGENIAIVGIGTDPDGTIVSYEWLLNDTQIGSSAILNTRLPDGVHDLVLIVTDNSGDTGTDTVRVTVDTAQARATLANLPNLTPNQRKLAVALDRVCGQLDAAATPSLNNDQRDLLGRCNAIYFNSTTGQQVGALEQLIPDDFALARTQTLLFANTQYVSVMDRLIALRGGARRLSLAGLNIIVDGKPVPLAQLQEIARSLLGGGASADEPGGLLSDKWGLWARGNYSFGDKDRSPNSPAFDADQWAVVAGLDYRLSDKAVLGGAASYGRSQIEFNPVGEGGLDTDSWAVSLYGSVYAAKNFYFDAILNGANSSYEAERNISYVNGLGLVSADASGDTDGMTWSGGLSGGYDFLVGALTISPNLGVFYIDTTIDGFTESGAGGLNLIYDEQQFESLTGNLGVRLTYAWNLSWGVLLPHLRVDYVREFQEDVEVFGVRFASDPSATSAPPILVETDNPDQSYWRLATGLSAQFKHGISGYVEYQRLESFEFISFQDVSIGLRMQRSF